MYTFYSRTRTPRTEVRGSPLYTEVNLKSFRPLFLLLLRVFNKILVLHQHCLCRPFLLYSKNFMFFSIAFSRRQGQLWRMTRWFQVPNVYRH